MDESDSDDSVHTIVFDDAPDTMFAYMEMSMLPKLSRAIIADDFETFKTLLTDDDVLKVDNLQNTPLHYAVMSKKIQMVELLIAHPKVDVNVLNCYDATPLLLAIATGCKNTFEQLLAADCDVNLGNEYQLPLHAAIENRDASWVHALIKKGANVNSIAAFRTPLIEAVSKDSLECVCMLLYYGADVTITDEKNANAFMYACNEYRCPELAQEILPYMIDFSHTDEQGFNCLHLALNCYHPIAQELLDVAHECINNITNLGYPVIYFTLFYDTCDLFKKAWYKTNFDIVQLSSTSFLDDFFQSTFTFSNWLEVLEMIIHSGRLTEIIQRFSGRRTILTNVLVRILKHKCSCTFDERMTWMILFASYGAEITLNDIVEVCNIFGYTKDVKTLLKIEPNPVSITPVQIHFILKYVFGLANIPSYGKLVEQFVYSVNEDRPIVHETLALFRYFSLLSHIDYLRLRLDFNEKFINLVDIVECLLTKNGMVPSLTELSRNAVRRTMFSNNVSWVVINNWQIPEVVKKILRFETPVNRLPNEKFQVLLYGM